MRLCLELLPEGGPEEGLQWGLEALLLPACQAVQAAPCRTLMEGLKAAGGGLTCQGVQAVPCKIKREGQRLRGRGLNCQAVQACPCKADAGDELACMSRA